MAIVKATYTKSDTGAKASIRYIEHRKGKDGAKITRPLFGSDGLLGRQQAYHMIDEVAHGSYFYRFVISPDMQSEDTHRDLSLREITEATMLRLEDRFQGQLQWAAAVHDDHAPHRHVHLLAIVPGRLDVQDFRDLRQTATEAAREQRRHRDLAREEHAREREGEEWERER